MLSCTTANVQMIYDCVHVFFSLPTSMLAGWRIVGGVRRRGVEGAKVWVVLREGWYGTQGIYDPLSSPQC
jgi:hypothetical protein